LIAALWLREGPVVEAVPAADDVEVEVLAA
jgi:hypothetical protein